jgi:hypothetical protein
MIGNIRVLFHAAPDTYGVQIVDSATATFQVVSFGIILALDILESSAGGGELRATGQAVVDVYRQKTLREGPLKLVVGNQLPPDFVGRFLTAIRSDFPTIAISTRVEGDAYTARKSWYVASDEPANDPIPTYLPKEAGVLFIDKGVSALHISIPYEAFILALKFLMAMEETDMCLQYSSTGQLVDDATVAAEDTFRKASPENSANLDKFLFILGLTIAHELVHFFTGRIVGDPHIDTPPRVQHPAKPSTKVGEAGRFWENRLLGYRIECYWDPKDALKQKQAGALYAFANNGTVAKVAPSWVRQTVLSRK